MGLGRQMYTADELMKKYLSKEDDCAEFVEFLNNFSVFTRGYAFRSGLIDRFGDYTPKELRK